MPDSEKYERFEMELKEFREILIRIEKRLTGDMSSNEPGLLEDMRTLKRDVKFIESNIQSINTTISGIQGVNAQEHINTLNTEVKELKEKIGHLYRDKYVFYGAMSVLIILGQKLLDWIVGKL